MLNLFVLVSLSLLPEAGFCLEKVVGLDSAEETATISSEEQFPTDLEGNLEKGVAPNPPPKYLTRVKSITAGSNFACAVVGDAREVFCWGAAPGLSANSSIAKKIDFPSPVEKIVAAESDACALTQDGKTYCWGLNMGSSTPSQTSIGNTFTDIFGSLGFLGKISTPSDQFLNLGQPLLQYPIANLSYWNPMKMILQHARVRCGTNLQNQLSCEGNKYFNGMSINGLNSNVIPATKVKDFDLASTHVCAVVEDENHGASGVYCWGYNYMGVFGNGEAPPSDLLPYIGNSAPSHTSPTPGFLNGLIGGEVPMKVSTSDYNTCILTSFGNVRCAGGNVSGQLGNNSQTHSFFSVKSNVNAKAIAVGSLFACALKNDETVECWGANSMGQAGVGYSSPHPAGVLIPKKVVLNLQATNVVGDVEE